MSEHLVLVRGGLSNDLHLLDAEDDTHAVLNVFHNMSAARLEEVTEVRVIRVDEMRDGKPIHPDDSRG